MTHPGPSDPPLEELRAEPDTPPRPEEEVADAGGPPADVPPVAGGSLGGEPAQGEGAPDSY